MQVTLQAPYSSPLLDDSFGLLIFEVFDDLSAALGGEDGLGLGHAGHLGAPV